MLALNWKFLTPVSLALLILTALIDKAYGNSGVRIPALLIGNAAVLFLTWRAMRVFSRRQRKERQMFKKRPVAKPA